MALELIDEQFGLWACNISDLNEEQKERIVNSWQDGAGIESLIAFSDGERIVLNRERAEFPALCDFLRLYLSAAGEQRRLIQKKTHAVGDWARELVEIANHALLERYAVDIIPILKRQILDFDELDHLFAVLHKLDCQNYDSWACVNAYLLGRIEGIRRERARKKRTGKYSGRGFA